MGSPVVYDGEEVTDAFDQRTKYKWQLASGGVCFVCAGCVGVEYVRSPTELDRHDRYTEFFAEEQPALFHLSCQNCSFFSYIPVGIRLLDSPKVIGSLATRGIDVSDQFLWELPFVTEADCVTVEDTEPWQVRVDAPTPTGTIAVTLGDSTEITSITESL